MKKRLKVLLPIIMVIALCMAMAVACAPTEETYTVTYVAGGGEGTAPTEVAHKGGEQFALKENTFTNAGKVFAGWSDGKNTYNEKAQYTMPNANVTLTAQWNAESKTYGVTYSAGEGVTGTVPTESNKAKDDVITLKGCEITRTGYVFEGWSDGTTTYQPGDSVTMPDSALTLTAIWAKVYKVTYDKGAATSGESPVDSCEYKKDSKAIVKDKGTLAKPGCDFVGWKIKTPAPQAGAEIEIYNKGEELTMPESDVVLEATFENRVRYGTFYGYDYGENEAPVSLKVDYVEGENNTFDATKIVASIDAGSSRAPFTDLEFTFNETDGIWYGETAGLAMGGSTTKGDKIKIEFKEEYAEVVVRYDQDEPRNYKFDGYQIVSTLDEEDLNIILGSWEGYSSSNTIYDNGSNIFDGEEKDICFKLEVGKSFSDNRLEFTLSQTKAAGEAAPTDDVTYPIQKWTIDVVYSYGGAFTGKLVVEDETNKKTTTTEVTVKFGSYQEVDEQYQPVGDPQYFIKITEKTQSSSGGPGGVVPRPPVAVGGVSGMAGAVGVPDGGSSTTTTTYYGFTKTAAAAQ